MGPKPRPSQACELADAKREGLHSIGEAARQSGVSAKMIRHYEAIGLLGRSVRTAANYRVYSDGDLHQLRFIRRARQLGFSIKQIKELVGLWQNTQRSSGEVKQLVVAQLQDMNRRIAELQEMRDALAQMATQCHGDQRPQCPILEALAAADECGQTR